MAPADPKARRRNPGHPPVRFEGAFSKAAGYLPHVISVCPCFGDRRLPRAGAGLGLELALALGLGLVLALCLRCGFFWKVWRAFALALHWGRLAGVGVIAIGRRELKTCGGVFEMV